MGTSRTHYRRSYRDIVLQSDKVVLLAKELLCDNGLRELADVAEDLLALNVVHANIAAVLLDDAVKLLDNVDLVVLCGKVLDQLHRKRIYHTQLQDRSLVAESLLDVLVSGAVGDNAELSAVRELHTVERRGLSVLDQLLSPLLNENVSALCKCRHHNVFLGIFCVFLQGKLFPVNNVNDALGVSYSCGHSYDEGSVELLGKLKCQLHELLAFAGIRGLDHGHL